MSLFQRAAIAAILLIASQWGLAEEDRAPIVDDAVVYFYGFRVERITGIHEGEIEKLGCLYSIRKRSFLKSVIPGAPSGHYQPRDVRAKVIFGPHDIYFVDRFGNGRHGAEEFVVDRKMFAASLSQTKPCQAE